MWKFFKVSGELFVYIGVYMVMQILLTFMLGIFYWIRATVERRGIDPVKLQTLLNQQTLYIIIGSVICSFIIYTVLFRAQKEDLMACCNFAALKIRNAGLAVLLGITFNLTLSMVSMVTSVYKLFPGHMKLMEQLIGGDFVATLLIVGIAAPVFEEILFRGIVLNKLRQHVSLAAAILIQGLLFGIYHLNLLQGIYGAALGIFAGLIYIWFHSIWAPISLHVTFNTLSVMMSRLWSERLIASYGTEALIGSGIMLAVTVYLLWRNRLQASKADGVGAF
jgi:membrane protease YdiL (CAAX protease family)